MHRWPTRIDPQWWAWPAYFSVIPIFATLVWFLSLRPLINQHLWRTARTWYEGLLGIGIMYVFSRYSHLLRDARRRNTSRNRSRGPRISSSRTGSLFRSSPEAQSTFSTSSATPIGDGDDGAYRIECRSDSHPTSVDNFTAVSYWINRISCLILSISVLAQLRCHGGRTEAMRTVIGAMVGRAGWHRGHRRWAGYNA